MARRTTAKRAKAGIDVDLPTLRDKIAQQSRIRSVRGYVEVRREAGAEKMTFTTLSGLRALVAQLTEDTDG